ncbi:glycosyltransferase family 2 protein [Actinoplanes rectilineatus]|uniref:glycosyltransferase family 2 protein n=1 Tax=Actinoplanes rectilineatus TaxID=113571 RepID=UPI0005F2EB10|nr:glycosyltransferase family 2 protein [Actinoplanes rectilineatus]
MSDRISVVVPYRGRGVNLRIALAALADQRDPGEVEVILGVLDDDEMDGIHREFRDRLDLVIVRGSGPWRVAAARNLALRQASGRTVVLMDADMALPPGCLRDLREAHDGTACLVGQMVDYDNNTGDVSSVDVRPYEHHRKILEDLQETGPGDLDPRMRTPHVIPWSFAWTALIALPRAAAVDFDEHFAGYGVEDLEWAYRVARVGTPIVMGERFFGLHLPHVRDVAANRRTEGPNYRYFLRTWPDHDVELACAFGDFEANELATDFREVIGGREFVVAREGRRLTVGADVTRKADETLPLVGLALPYDDHSLDGVTIGEEITRLPARYRDKVLAEARRVTRP